MTHHETSPISEMLATEEAQGGTQAEHRARRAEYYRKRMPIGGVPLEEVVVSEVEAEPRVQEEGEE
jgi:hypothetical protein